MLTKKHILIQLENLKFLVQLFLPFLITLKKDAVISVEKKEILPS